MPFRDPSPWDKVPGESSESQQEVELPPEMLGVLNKLNSTQLEGVMQVAEVLGRVNVPKEMLDALQQLNPDQMRAIWKVACDLKDVRKDQESRALKSYEKSFTLHGVAGSLKYVGEFNRLFRYSLEIPQWQINIGFEAGTIGELERFMSSVDGLQKSASTPEEARDRLMKAIQTAPSFGGTRSLNAVRFE